MATPIFHRSQQRIYYFMVFLAAALGLLFFRLWQLQVLGGEKYQMYARTNRIRLIEEPAPRGQVMARGGEILVVNRPCFGIYAIPADLKDAPKTLSRLAAILDTPEEEFALKIGESRGVPYQPVLLKWNVDLKTVSLIEEQKIDLPGVIVRVQPMRIYSDGDFASHLLGYMGEISKEQLVKAEFKGYKRGDFIGQYGLERAFNQQLSGANGGLEIEVNALGREVRTLNHIIPKTGTSLRLTIDKRLQQAVERAMSGQKGAVVAIDPHSGEILALLSKPSYDPNMFAAKISVEDWQKITLDPWRPLYNRALMSQYPPGSVFKLITAAAALERGVATPETHFRCGGSFVLGGHEYKCWNKGGHGYPDLYHSITQSCNVYHYQLGLRAGIDEIARLAHELGLGEKVGVGVGDEAKGLVPTPQWKKKVQGGEWYGGNTVITAIGQGMISATPLQLANAVAAIANGGTLYRPTMVKSLEAEDGEVLQQFEPQIIRQVNISPETLAFLRKAMWGVVNDGGTGSKAHIPKIGVSGKTGTAQVVKITEARKRAAARGVISVRDHAWFVCFAPYDNPEVAMAVFVEHGGAGGQAAAPVAKQILQAYFAAKSTPPPSASEPETPLTGIEDGEEDWER